ncbi:hypothetical protein [uncultured Gemmobacter sp.]|uniref:hypothetical protein n=1 Tax=uncultured Gemmobacter sp. TaxID=1095917 RepID=UPI000AF62E8B|nr:hypothetical protein [uncultured Gemmobacter sp.]
MTIIPYPSTRHGRTPLLQRDAMAICAAPGDHAHRPSLYAMAWLTLKSARGQIVHQHRLRASHMIDHSAGGEAA